MILAPRARKVALTAHVVVSVGWLGAVLAFLVLSVVALGSDNEQLVRAIHLAAEPLVWFVVVPLALASLVTGIIQALGTRWGLFRHYWVVFKLVIAVVATAILLLYTRTVSTLADVAADPAAGAGDLRSATFVLHSGAALAMLLAATVLAVFKPPGVIRYGALEGDTAARPGTTETMTDSDDPPARLTPAQRAQQKRQQKLADVQELIDSGQMTSRQLTPEEMEEHAKRREARQAERGKRKR